MKDSKKTYNIKTSAPGPKGEINLNEKFLLNAPSGDLFGLVMNTGMGWPGGSMFKPEVMIVSNKGGYRSEDGSPTALGLHTGHYELGLQVEAAAKEITKLGAIPFATYVTDPCDGRTQGTTGMFDSLPYRNDAAVVMRRLVRSLPTRVGTIGIATCDKGLPGTMMALASLHDEPTILVPGGVTLPPTDGEDLAMIQTIGSRFARGEISLADAKIKSCRSCASAGGGCHFFGTAATSQVVAEGLGLALTHSALAPSGQPIWKEIATHSAQHLLSMYERGITTKDILTDKALHNAMVIHAATGGSTNLLLHIPAIAHAAGLKLPTLEDWIAVNKKTPRIVSVLPNGPVNHPTLRMFLAGGVPEVMLHLRDLGLLHLDALTVTGKTLGENLEWWETSDRRQQVRETLLREEGVHPDEVIMSPTRAKERGLTSTITFPVGNIAPQGSVVKSTSIDPSKIDENGVYQHVGAAKVFTSEKAAIKAIKEHDVQAGDIMVVTGLGPLGTGMEETYQLTGALKYLSYGKDITLITDARFSGVSTGACIGHVGPEGLDDGPIGKIQNGDIIEVIIDCRELEGSINFIGTADQPVTPEEGAAILAARPTNPELKPHEKLPDDTRLWAAMQRASGGTWNGAIYDVDKIIDVINKGLEVIQEGEVE